jgi:hypothetical protein
MIERTASCACGATGLTARGEPARISMCHCGGCKRRTGSAFSLNATWPQDQVAVRGDCTTYERSNEEGLWVRERFCPTCGTRTFYELEVRPGMVSVPVGLFMDPDFPPPRLELYRDIAMCGMTATFEPPPEPL